MSLSKNLFYLRKKNKITQEELADRLGVSRQSVSKWETGEASPETDKLIALSDFYGVSLDELVRTDLTGEGSEEREEKENAFAASTEKFARRVTSGVARARVCEAICGVIMLAVTAIYLILGFVFSLWHPGWVVFPIAGIACGILRLVCEFKGNKDDDKKDDD